MKILFLLFRLYPFPTLKKDPAKREKWKMLVNRSSNKKLWDPSKDSRVCSLHFVDGEPTELNPNPTLHMGYDSHKKAELLSPVGVKRKIKYRQHEDFVSSISKRKMGPRKKTANHVETAAGLSNMPANTTETTQKSQSDKWTFEDHLLNRVAGFSLQLY